MTYIKTYTLQGIHITPQSSAMSTLNPTEQCLSTKSRHGPRKGHLQANSPVKIHEETEQVETKLDHGFFHVWLQLPSIVDFCWVKHSHVTTWHHNEPDKLKDAHILEGKSTHQQKHSKLSNQKSSTFKSEPIIAVLNSDQIWTGYYGKGTGHRFVFLWKIQCY